MVDFYHGRPACTGNNLADSLLAKLAGRNQEPGGGTAIRIRIGK